MRDHVWALLVLVGLCGCARACEDERDLYSIHAIQPVDDERVLVHRTQTGVPAGQQEQMNRCLRSWSEPLEAARRAPQVQCPEMGPDLLALEAEGGRLHWEISFETRLDDLDLTVVAEAGVFTHRAVSDGRQEIWGRDLADGRLRWKHRRHRRREPDMIELDGPATADYFEGLPGAKLSDHLTRHGIPLNLVHEETLILLEGSFVADDPPAAEALEARTGRRLWRAPLRGAHPLGPLTVWVRGEHLFVPINVGRKLIAIHLETGASRRIEVPEGRSICALDDALLISTESGALHRVDAASLEVERLPVDLHTGVAAEDRGTPSLRGCGTLEGQIMLSHALSSRPVSQDLSAFRTRIVGLAEGGRGLSWALTFDDDASVSTPWGAGRRRLDGPVDFTRLQRYVPLRVYTHLYTPRVRQSLEVLDLRTRRILRARDLGRLDVLERIRLERGGALWNLTRMDDQGGWLLLFDGETSRFRLLSSSHDLRVGLHPSRLTGQRLWTVLHQREVRTFELPSLQPVGWRDGRPEDLTERLDELLPSRRPTSMTQSVPSGETPRTSGVL